MNSSFRALLVLTCILGVPASVQAADDAQCRASATDHGIYARELDAIRTGWRPARRCRQGAAAGAVVGGAQANQYDNAPDALQDQHRKTRPRATPRQEWLWPDRVIGASAATNVEPLRTMKRRGRPATTPA